MVLDGLLLFVVFCTFGVKVQCSMCVKVIEICIMIMYKYFLDSFKVIYRL